MFSALWFLFKVSMALSTALGIFEFVRERRSRR